jgi:ABC-2 type transport system ATP-binding protein
MSSDLLVRFECVGKRYRLGRRASLRDALARLPARRCRERHGADVIWALRELDLGVSAGEALGVIGANGTGKTTLLKLVAGITHPTEGAVEVAGAVASLIELGAGFHPDLSGRENVYLNGAILGLSSRTIRRRFDSIVDFAEIARFIDSPVKHYSSGMYARLGFAVAAHVDADVLLLDEVLAVGDVRFQSKCYRKMTDLLAQGTATVLVSHNPYVIRDYCTRAILLEQGRLAREGTPLDVIREYQTRLAAAEAAAAPLAPAPEDEALALDVRGPAIRHEAGIPTVVGGTPVAFEIRWRAPRPVERPVIGLEIEAFGSPVRASYATDFDGVLLPQRARAGTLRLRFERFDFPVGTYRLGLVLSDGRRERHVLWRPEAAALAVVQGDDARGTFALPHRWDTEAASVET